MLQLPSKGISRSITKHNSDLDIISDWIEASVLFIDKRVSRSDIIDILTEEQIYDDQDFAGEFVDDAWTELRKRQNLLGDGCPFKLTSTRIERIHDWKITSAHSFCILLSLLVWYPKWAKQFGQDYTLQGELFENLSKESLELQLKGWTFYLTGWSRSKTKKLKDVVKDISDQLNEKQGDLERWIGANANEAGLDVLYFRPYFDNRPGIPVYLLQCASGADWESKLKTPDLDVWEKIIDFASKPQKAFSLPFALLNDIFLKKCVLVKGVLLDRYRILSPAIGKPNWLSDELDKKLIKWMEPRLKKLSIITI